LSGILARGWRNSEKSESDLKAESTYTDAHTFEYVRKVECAKVKASRDFMALSIYTLILIRNVNCSFWIKDNLVLVKC
jgi:hypothetical protein